MENNEQKITDTELNERVAIVKRFKALLISEKNKFQEYLTVLEKQGASIESEDSGAIGTYTKIENSIVGSITNLQKVVVPFYKMYRKAVSASSTDAATESGEVDKIEVELASLKEKVLEQNQKNRSILVSHLESIQKQINNFKNPYKNIGSVYARRAGVSGSLVAIDA